MIQGSHCETMTSNLIVTVIIYCQRTSTTLLPWEIAK